MKTHRIPTIWQKASFFLLSILLTSSASMAKEINRPVDSASLRLELQRVYLYTETNQIDEARALLEELKAKYPNNTQVLLAESDFNLRTGNRGAGLFALNQAFSLDAGNEDILHRQRSALLTQGAYIAAGARLRRTSDTNEYLTSLDGQSMLTPSISSRLLIENNHIDTRNPLQRSDGTFAEFDGNRQRVTASFSKIYESGNEASIRIHAGNEVLGTGAQFSWWDQLGTTSLQGNYHRPEWDYVWAAIEHGTRDNIKLERRQRIFQAVDATLGAGFNRYGLKNDNNVAQAAAVNIALGYPHILSLSDQPDNTVMLWLNYSMDAEYFTSLDYRTPAGGGARFSALPVESYEIHALTLSARHAFSDKLEVEGYGGYGVDRLGSNGALYGLVFDITPLDNMAVELFASRSLMGERRNDTVEIFGINLRWFW